MMNYVWVIMIIFSLIAAFITDNMSELSSTLITSGNDAIELALKLSGVICLWGGLMSIAEKSGLTKIICKIKIKNFFKADKEDKRDEYRLYFSSKFDRFNTLSETKLEEEIDFAKERLIFRKQRAEEHAEILKSIKETL